MKRLWFALLSCGFGLLAFTSFMYWSGGQLVVQQEEIPLSGIQHTVRILHVSDIHYQGAAGVTLAFVSRVIALAADQKPDLILITGDFIFDQCAYPKEYAQVLSGFPKIAPTYATFGNHDGGRWAGARGGYPDCMPMATILRDAGIKPLLNTSTRVNCGQNNLEIIGLGDLWAGDFLPDSVFDRIEPSGCPRIVLSHNPDTLPMLKEFHWNLMLSGHTHGGQVRLPFIGSPWAPVEDRSHLGGLYPIEERWLHVSRGTGGEYRLRFRCPPEITVLTLMPLAR